jgi:transposase
MIPHGVEIFVGLEPIDLRWGFHKLAGIAHERIGRNAKCGALFVFFGKRRDALKILFFDSTGICLFYKRLNKGVFRLPTPHGDDDASVLIEERELDELLDGVAIEPSQPKKLVKKQVVLIH